MKIETEIRINGTVVAIHTLEDNQFSFKNPASICYILVGCIEQLKNQKIKLSDIYAALKPKKGKKQKNKKKVLEGK